MIDPVRRRLPTTVYRLPSTDYRLPSTDYRLWIPFTHILLVEVGKCVVPTDLETAKG